MQKTDKETKEYLDYIVGKLKQGKPFSVTALEFFVKEKNLDTLDFLSLVKQRLKKERIDELPKAKKFRQLVENRMVWIEKGSTPFFEEWIKKKGYPSRHAYETKLARDKGFKSHSDYLEKLAKDKGFKSHYDYRKKLAKDKFVSRFAALLEAGVPPKKAAAMVLPLTKSRLFPKKKLGQFADEAVAAARRKKLPAHR